MAAELREAMEGWGTDEGALIDCICSKTFEEMAEISTEYASEYDTPLIDAIKSECSGDFENSLVALCTPRAEYDAQLLKKAFKGFGTNEDLMCEALCYRTKEELADIKKAFETLYDQDLETAIEGETSGNTSKVLLKLIDVDDEKSEDAEDEKAVEEACEKLYKAGEKKFGTDEGVFIRILAGNSRAFREALYWKYPDVSKKGKSLTKVIKSEFSGTLEAILVALVEPTEIYYAEVLNKAMKGIGTDEDTLIRVLVTQKERFLQKIGEHYLKEYEQGLKQHIESEISGDFKKCLLAVCENWCKLGDE